MTSTLSLPPSERAVAGGTAAMTGGAGTKLPGAGDTVPGAGETVPGAGDTGPGAGDTAPGAGETVRGVGDTGPGAGDTGPAVGDIAPGAGETVPGTGDTAPGFGVRGAVFSTTGAFAGAARFPAAGGHAASRVGSIAASGTRWASSAWAGGRPPWVGSLGDGTATTDATDFAVVRIGAGTSCAHIHTTATSAITLADTMPSMT